jgi:hypothetical protein
MRRMAYTLKVFDLLVAFRQALDGTPGSHCADATC